MIKEKKEANRLDFNAALVYCLEKSPWGAAKDAAKAVGIRASYVSQIKRGQRVGNETIRRGLAEFFGYEYQEFLRLGQGLKGRTTHPGRKTHQQPDCSQGD